jgi:hypothetical protein
MSHLRPSDPNNPGHVKAIADYSPDEQRHAAQQIVQAHRDLAITGTRQPGADALALAEQLARAGGDETVAGEAAQLAKDIASRPAKPK